MMLAQLLPGCAGFIKSGPVVLRCHSVLCLVFAAWQLNEVSAVYFLGSEVLEVSQ